MTFSGNGSGCKFGDKARVCVDQRKIPQQEECYARDVPELYRWRGVELTQGNNFFSFYLYILLFSTDI